MKTYIKWFVLVLLLLIVQTSFAQENRSVKDIAFDYLKKQKGFDNHYNADNADVFKFSNGNVFVKLYVKRYYTVRDTYYVPNGINYINAQGGITRTYTAYKDHNESVTSVYRVFLNRYGAPIKCLEFNGRQTERFFSNSMLVFGYGGSRNVDGYNQVFYTKLQCYSSEGELIEENNNLAINSIEETPNYLYLVGEINSTSGSRSIVRIINRKTNNTKDKLGELGEIDYNLMFTAEGISITKHKNNGEPIRYIIPYEAEDENYQVQKIMEGQDLASSSGQVYLGELYLKGEMLRKNEHKAFELFQKAANKNDEKGMLKLAQCFQNGWGVEKNISTAITYYEKCANLGNNDAMITLSDMYLQGNGIPANMSEALYWEERLGILGDKEAQRYVIKNADKKYRYAIANSIDALALARKNYNSKNYPWAKFCYERAISFGSKDATYELGKWLYEGNGIGKDIPKAVELLGNLGEKGNFEAQKLLASIYRENSIINSDDKQEAYWNQKAAENGDAESQAWMGGACLNGIYIPKDKKKSAEWYEKAAMQNHQEATRFTILNYMNGNGVKKDVEKVIYFFTHLNTYSQLEFADNVFNGVGMRKNQRIAARMYGKMAQNGNMIAAKKLAFCYLDGIGVRKNIEIAYQLAMEIRNTTHNGSDGDIYYIEAKYLERKYHEPANVVVDSYIRAIEHGCSRAKNDFVRYQRKYGLRL